MTSIDLDLPSILALSDVGPLLATLNARVPHRFTAIYRLVDDSLVTLVLYDKSGLVRREHLLDAPLNDRFCQFILRDHTELDAVLVDEEDGGAEGRKVMVAYHGVPVVDADGEICGSLCHFDTEPRALPLDELQLLQKVARLLPVHALPQAPAAG